MSSDTPLTKRIKRHVIGRERTFFAATAPGLESLCLQEIRALGPTIKNEEITTGGVEFRGQLQECYLANLHLRTAGRILMRINRFNATSFSQLVHNVAGIPWELYLPPTSSPKIQVKTKQCRLYHTDAICERFFNVIQKHPGFGPYRRDFAEGKGGATQPTIFVRGIDDRFTVSLDSSGDHLHKRGLKRHPGKAPLRETMAAAALILAGYSQGEPLIDPMCGTGTFSLEAALMAKNIPPGWFREFAFMDWPSFRRKRWEFLKRQCEPGFTTGRSPSIFASDKDPSACRRLSRCREQHGLSDVLTVTRKNFSDIIPGDLTDKTGVIAINPPYGRRLGSRRESERLFQSICTRLKREYKGWKLILIAPGKRFENSVPFRLRVIPFSHGGLNPLLMTGTIP